MLVSRKHDESGHGYIDPSLQLNAGLWTLFAGASLFLALRIWIKITRRRGLWYDDYILIASWFILAINNSLISLEFATGYVTDTWDARMHILITITSCGTLINQALTKTAFAVTLLKLTKAWTHSGYQWVLWFCIGSMNIYMIAKVIVQWGKICGKSTYDVSYRLDFCVDSKFRDDFKEGGNVYNIIMDFVLATFPWVLTWNLDMRKAEKIGLCVTMSLGMIVAIVSAIRTGWKDEGNVKDEWYFWRNAHSNIWYSSEIVGTIIVQCIPVLRPLIRDMHTSMTSKKLDDIATCTSKHKTPESFVQSNHKAHIYSNARSTYHDNDDMPDSWDNQGIYHKKDFELTTMQVKGKPDMLLV
ncbi:hypothetical protein BDU57DRAFT_537963 [Ampelomyces quisqualis]|uniref:Rhodopsin domain-containing protein n=1 Tax=Ampelomyces quisqualis TaxID=50730 RepID=A0A6A5QV18_AMPQU|nr:hypothetical protein BDU57DRAFT_537963 [Ampelomyces quisqualis]